MSYSLWRIHLTSSSSYLWKRQHLWNLRIVWSKEVKRANLKHLYIKVSGFWVGEYNVSKYHKVGDTVIWLYAISKTRYTETWILIDWLKELWKQFRGKIWQKSSKDQISIGNYSKTRNRTRNGFYPPIPNTKFKTNAMISSSTCHFYYLEPAIPI